jgi:iron complex transport system substrate-binding protein
MAYAAGAGDALVGVVAFSDHPPAAKTLPRVGDAFRVDYEVLADLAPDLVVAWRTGNPAALIEQLQRLGYRVEEFDAPSLTNLPGQMRRLGQLASTEEQAERAAKLLQDGLARLELQFRSATPVRVFYQVAREPLFTVSDAQIIGQVIRLCGGRNVFGELDELAPVVGIESVLASKPEVILLAGPPAERETSRRDWQRWTAMPAVANGEIHDIDADLVSRPGPRLVSGAEQVCRLIDGARGRTGVSPVPSAR